MGFTKKQKVATGVVGAGVLTVALLSGGTLANWNSSADADGTGVTSGNLQIASVSGQATDISPDRADAGHVINLDTWRAVPGDVVQLENTFDVALEGDNLVATLDASNLEASIPVEAQQYVTTSIKLQTADGQDIAPDANGNYLLQAGGEGQDAGQRVNGITVVDKDLDGTPDVKAVATVNFSIDTPERVLTEANLANVEGAGVTLTQVRM